MALVMYSVTDKNMPVMLAVLLPHKMQVALFAAVLAHVLLYVSLTGTEGDKQRFLQQT